MIPQNTLVDVEIQKLFQRSIPSPIGVCVRSDTQKRARAVWPLIIGLLMVLSISSSMVVQEEESPEVPITTEGSSPAGSDDDYLNRTQVVAELPGPTNDASFGTYLNYAGDITGDGCDDIL